MLGRDPEDRRSRSSRFCGDTVMRWSASCACSFRCAAQNSPWRQAAQRVVRNISTCAGSRSSVALRDLGQRRPASWPASRRARRRARRVARSRRSASARCRGDARRAGRRASAPVHGVELRREVVEVEHVGVIGTRGAQRRLPRRRRDGRRARAAPTANTTSGTPSRSSYEGCIGCGAAIASPPASKVRTASVESRKWTSRPSKNVGAWVSSPATPSDPTASETDHPARASAGLRYRTT